MQKVFSFVWQVKGVAGGNERAKTDVLISLLAHPLLPFLQESFTSFAEPPSALRVVNPFAGSTQRLFSAAHWMLPIPTCTCEGKACGSKYGQGHIPGHFFPQQPRGDCLLQKYSLRLILRAFRHKES